MIRFLRGRPAVAVVLVVLGFLVPVQLRSQEGEAGLGNLSVQELTELVANVTARNGQLRDEIRTLEQQRAAVETAVRRGDTSVAQVRSDLERVLAWSGALPVRGPGVRVTLAGGVPAAAVAEVLNELRNAGAEAIAVGSVRVATGVIVSGETGALAANGIPLAEPLVVVAIGRAETLAGSLARSGGPIAQLGVRYPSLEITVGAEDLIELGATSRSLAPVLGRPRL